MKYFTKFIYALIFFLINKYIKLIKYALYSYLNNHFSNEIICMCSIAKEENLYIRDFIQHYKQLGYNHFYIYDNNDRNGEILKEAISDEINSGLVSVFDYRNYRANITGPQMDAYYHCYENNKNNCDWLSFFDIDEYLILDKKFTSLQQLLNNKIYHNCEGILINWKIFHDNNYLEYRNISLTKRFTGIKKNWGNNASKLIARGQLTKNLSKSYSTHSLWYNLKFCNTLGKNISFRFSITPPSFKYAYISHYYTKTITEYCKKIKRGNAYYNISLNPNILRKKFNVFFSINNKTRKKLKIFNNFFNTSFKLV